MIILALFPFPFPLLLFELEAMVELSRSRSALLLRLRLLLLFLFFLFGDFLFPAFGLLPLPFGIIPVEACFSKTSASYFRLAALRADL